jgi:O-antigen/teichoic acid export membrane protein
MANLKSLAKDTVIYGFTSIVGRFLNYLLVPLYTAKISAASGGYGVITNIYSYVALIIIILTFGMETTFFRFSNKDDEKPADVISTSLLAVSGVSLLFVALIFLSLPWLAPAMGYADHPSYISVMAVVVALDAVQSILYAYLRYQHRPIKFATLKFLFIILNILLNLLYFLWLPELYKSYPDVIGKIYDPTVGVGYAFYLNLVCTGITTLCFYKEFASIHYRIDWALLKRMLKYTWPLLLLGIVGILNQTADKILYPYIDKTANGRVQLGIYGAACKIAMIMAIITNAFRWAYEPFVFGKSRDKDNREAYAAAMKYFIIFTLLAFLMVMAWIDILKFIIAPDYWEGLKVVPIVMAAEIMMGVYFNLSFWYKLIDKTIYGAWFSLAGCAVLLAVNYFFIPQYSYMACAWGGVAGYGTAMVLSYIVGQVKNPIPYPMKSIMIYVLMTALFYTVMHLTHEWHLALRLLINTLLILLFCAYVYWHEIRKR